MRQLIWLWRTWSIQMKCRHMYLDQPWRGWGMMWCPRCNTAGYCMDAEARQRYIWNNELPPYPAPVVHPEIPPK